MPHVVPLQPTTLLGLVNGFAAAPREAAGETDLDYPALELPDHLAPIGNRQLATLADQLWEVFDGASDPTRRDRLLTDLLDAAQLRPVIIEPGVLAWTTRHRARLNQLAAACATTLAQTVDRHGWEHIGTCAGSDCVDALMDITGGTRRIYCSTTCLNRAKVRAYRARRSGQHRALGSG